MVRAGLIVRKSAYDSFISIKPITRPKGKAKETMRQIENWFEVENHNKNSRNYCVYGFVDGQRTALLNVSSIDRKSNLLTLTNDKTLILGVELEVRGKPSLSSAIHWWDKKS